MDKNIFTIGYAGKSLEEFLLCLKANKIHYLLDIRSEPYSKVFPNYNKDDLKAFLSKHNIVYVYYGDYFGARRKENEVYQYTFSKSGHLQEQVFFSEVYKTEMFQLGVEKVLNKINNNWNVCFMCSEKEPVNCHRFWMVAFYFEYFLNPGIKSINIIDSNIFKTSDLILEEIGYEKAKKEFYKDNEFEIEGYSLFGFRKTKWVEWWNNFYNEPKNILLKKQQFANYLIGYVKGNKEYD